MKIHTFKYAGRIYIPIDELKSWFQQELLSFLEDKETDEVKEALVAYLKIQMSCFEKLEEDI